MTRGYRAKLAMVSITLFALQGLGCAAGGSAGGGGAGGNGANEIEPNQNNPNQSGGGGDSSTDTGSVEGGANPDVPIIDCSGRPVLETGVNLTPFSEIIPTTALPAAVVGDLPEMVDLADDFPSPCHQGELRSCVAWSTTYGLMTYFATTQVPDWGAPTTSDKQFSPKFTFNLANAFVTGRSRADACVRAGSYVSDVLTLLQDTGCVLMADMPHENNNDCLTKPDPNLIAAAAEFRIAYFRKVEQDVISLKAYLAQDIPVLVVIAAADAFVNLGAEPLDEAPEQGSAHAVVLIGYDDDRSAFRLLNSWGENWGDGGYGWISYAIWDDFVLEAWVAGANFDAPAGSLATGPMNPYADSDGDGLADTVEVEFGFDPNTPDIFGDMPGNLSEADADLDGWPDTVEQTFGTDTNDAADFPFRPGYEYPDGFFDQFDAASGVLESDEDLAGGIGDLL